MGRYRVLIKPSAVKEIETIPQKKDRVRIVSRIQQLADNPRPPGFKKLSGHEYYRIRQGTYRVVYAVHDNELVVYVVKVGHHKDIYRAKKI